MRKVLTLALIVMMAGLCGCLKYKHEIIVMPDGSGKIITTVAFKESVQEQMKRMDQFGGGGFGGGAQMPALEDPTEVDLEELEKNCEGIVAFTEPEKESKDGWSYVSYTMYFTDINEVKLFNNQGGTRNQMFEFKYKKKGSGHELNVNSNVMAGGEDTAKQADQVGDLGGLGGMQDQWKKQIDEALEGFLLEERYSMPGKIKKSSKGITEVEEERVGIARVTDEELDGDLDKFRELQKVQTRKIICGKSELHEDVVMIFQEELAEAIATWEELKDGGSDDEENPDDE